jgi:hypothetical protein
MDKRYQVFVSSTFTDLNEERQAVLRAILELDHMPAGMELFPASDDDAWQLIRDVIDGSDYYVLIVGGRYGSLDETGIGFTEKEYDYALASKKPVIALLHKNPDNLPRDKTETDKDTWQKLSSFRSKVEKKHSCVYWTSPEELKSKVIVSLTTELKRHPMVGWVRADQVPSESTLQEILALRKRVAELEASARHQQTEPPPGTEDLHQGEDTFTVEYTFDAYGPATSEADSYSAKITPTWDQIFAAIAPGLIDEQSEPSLRRAFKEFFVNYASESLRHEKMLAKRTLRHFEPKNDQDVSTCLIQLRALGLIAESDRKRSVHHKGTYWTLTRFGDYRMVQLRALRRNRIRRGRKRERDEG